MTRETLGWATAAVLFVLLLVRDVVGQWVTTGIRWLGQAVYMRLAGSWLGRRRAVTRYQRSLRRSYGHVPVPFHVGFALPMDDLFVPLQADGPDLEPVDAAALIRSFSRSVVLGDPGSGKSMLLRHLAYQQAMLRRRHFRADSLPVLVELHRLADPDTTLLDELAAQLARQDFPGAGRFLAQQLAKGRITVLLDGLDEVPASERDRVSRHICDFIATHDSCRYAITCRTAVYSEELWDVTEQTFRVVEFNDQQIGRFLRSWPQLDAGAVEELILVLRRNPRILSIARNPLLLTMIAYLYMAVYESQPQRLPHSRAEFYEDVIGLLLGQWHGPTNRFRVAAKRAVLQHIALVAQDQRGTDERLGLGFRETLAATRSMAPSIDLAPEDAQAVLDEIVERSGLLLNVDGGERYQFAHLTLQEHFAALALASRPDDLVARVEADPTRWRESVRLWCGLASDSTAVIGRLLGSVPLISLECLADATRVDEALADRVLETLRPELGGPMDARDEVARAFGAVASNPLPRGQAVLRWLVSRLEESTPRPIVIALSESGLEEAARALCRHGLGQRMIGTAIADMGDVAVPALAEAVRTKGLVASAAITSLVAIGTPAAGAAVASGMWSEDRVSAQQAAWALAHLIRSPSIEASLVLPADADQKAPAWYAAPFRRTPVTARAVIVHMMSLVIGSAGISPPFAPIDDRVAAGAALLEFQPSIDPYGRAIPWDGVVPASLRSRVTATEVGASRLVEQDEAAAAVLALLGGRRLGQHTDEMQEVSRWAVASLSAFSRNRGVLQAARPEIQPSLVAAFLGGTGHYSRDRYAELAKTLPKPLSTMRSWYAAPYAVAIGLSFALAASMLAGVGPARVSWLPAWAGIAGGVTLVAGLVSMVGLAQEGDVEEAALLPVLSWVFGPTLAINRLWRDGWLAIPIIIATPTTLILLGGLLALINRDLNPWIFFGVPAVACLIAGCLVRGYTLEKQSKNPFAELLSSEPGPDDHASASTPGPAPAAGRATPARQPR